MPRKGPPQQVDRAEVRTMAWDGRSNAHIARTLGCSGETVRRILAKQPKGWRAGRRLARIARDLAAIGADVLEDGRVDLADAVRIVARLAKRHKGSDG